MKARNFLIRQIPGHIGVRTMSAYVAALERAGFDIERKWFLPSDYPLFGLLDRIMLALGSFERWFQFRICIVASRRSR
jgi:hypothetical protein